MAHCTELAHDQLIKRRDIIAIGTSAGGVAALQTLVSGIPQDFGASVFVVMHTPGSRVSHLAEILSSHTALPVLNPVPDTAVEPGTIYVAPPDYHLLIERNERISLWHGPKENNFRPAINPLFRSAADVYGSRVVGVILTGSLDEGVAGLAWVKRHGGIAIVQDPQEALFPSMPESALQNVAVDYVVRVSAVAPLLVQLADGATPGSRHETRKED